MFKAYLFMIAVFVGNQAVTLPEARDQLDAFIEGVITAFNVAIREMEDFEEVIRQLSNAVVITGSQAVHVESVRLLNDLDDIINGATSDGFNVTSCIKGERTIIEELTSLSGLEVAGCANRFSSQAENALEKSMDNLDKIFDEIYEVSDQLDKCEPTNSACIGTVVTKVEFYVNDIPRRIQEEWDWGHNKAEGNRLLLQECGIRATESLIQKGSTLINNIDICVDQIIHPPAAQPLY